MATAENTLSLTTRAPEGSRAARRLRREGLVPGVLYGGEGTPEHFAVDGRILRNTLAHAGAILQVSVDGGGASPVLVKDVQRHPVRGHATHLDLLRVRMDQAVQTTVVLHLHGAEEAPGVVEGGILSQELRDLNVEALPGDLPEELVHDVSGMEMNATLTLEAIAAPQGVTLLDDPETVVATITPPTLEPVEEEIETETEIVGEEGAEGEAEAQAEGDTADEAAQKAEAADES